MEITESATAPRLMPLGFIVLSPCSRHRFARRQHEVTQTVTARAVNSAGYQSIVMLWRWVIRVLSGRWVVGASAIRGLRYAHPRLSASPLRLGVTCFA